MGNMDDDDDEDPYTTTDPKKREPSPCESTVAYCQTFLSFISLYWFSCCCWFTVKPSVVHLQSCHIDMLTASDYSKSYKDIYRRSSPHCTYNAVIGAVRQFLCFFFICSQRPSRFFYTYPKKLSFNDKWWISCSWCMLCGVQLNQRTGSAPLLSISVNCRTWTSTYKAMLITLNQADLQQQIGTWSDPQWICNSSVPVPRSVWTLLISTVCWGNKTKNQPLSI